MSLFIAVAQLVIAAAAVGWAVWMTRLRRAQREILNTSRTINDQLAEHRREHEQMTVPTALPASAGRPPANLDWRCPACGVHGEGYVPPGIEWAFGCPLCGVQVEATRRAPSVS